MVNVIGTYRHTYYNQQYLDTACNSASNATPVSKDGNNCLREKDFGKSDINISGQVLNNNKKFRYLNMTGTGHKYIHVGIKSDHV
jgi:hypothetical protein